MDEVTESESCVYHARKPWADTRGADASGSVIDANGASLLSAPFSAGEGSVPVAGSLLLGWLCEGRDCCCLKSDELR